MEKQMIQLSILIDAPKEKIWDVLLQDATYRQWTSVFRPGSYAETDGWKEGSKVLFKTPEGEGMFSKVILHKPCELISFEHLGSIKNHQEAPEDEEGKKWQGSKETYYLSAKDGKNELRIEQDITEEYAEWFTDTWKKALQKVKELSEM